MLAVNVVAPIKMVATQVATQLVWTVMAVHMTSKMIGLNASMMYVVSAAVPTKKVVILLAIQPA